MSRLCELCDSRDWAPRDRWDGICPKCRWKLGGVEPKNRSKPATPRRKRADRVEPT